MTSIRPEPKYEDDKTYPRFLGGRLIEVSGHVLNCKELARTKVISMDEWYNLIEQINLNQAIIAKMTKRIETLEQHILG